MGRKSTVSEDVKAAALADLAAGEQPATVAEKYGIPASKVRTWKTRYVAGNVAGNVANTQNTVAPVAPVAPEQPQQAIRKPTIEERHARLADRIYDLLEAKLEASRAISEHIKKEDWLGQQSGSDVADLGTYLDATASNIFAGLAAAAQRRAIADQRHPDSDDD